MGAAASDVPVIDSGTFAHITPHRHLLHDFARGSRVGQVLWGDGHSSPVEGSGTIRMLSGQQRVDVTGVLWVPDAHLTLLSVRRLVVSGAKIVFEGEFATVALAGRSILCGRARGGQYPLLASVLPASLLAAPVTAPPAAGGGPAAPQGSSGAAAASSSGSGTHHSAAAPWGSGGAAAPSGGGGTSGSSSASPGANSSSSSSAAAAPSGGGGGSSSSLTAAGLHAALRLHRRYAHLGWTALKQLVSESLVTGLDVDMNALCQAAESMCSTCIEAKAASLPFPDSSSSAPQQPLALAHSDLCGPMPVTGRGGSRYFVTLLDDASGVSAVRLLPTRDHAGEGLQEMIGQLEACCSLRGKLRYLRSDHGGEFVDQQLQQWLRDRGTVHTFSAPYTPQQNGAAERLNRTVMDRARALLFEAALPPSFWPEAVTYACHLRNLSPSSSGDTTPWEAFTGAKPDVSDLRTFGCRVFVTTPANQRDKLSPRASVGTYLGLQRNTAASRVLVGSKVVVSRDVQWDEDVRGPASRLAGVPFGVTAGGSGGGGSDDAAAVPSAGTAPPAPDMGPAEPAAGNPHPTAPPVPPPAPAAGPSRPATRSQRLPLTPPLAPVTTPSPAAAASAAAGGGGGGSSSAGAAAAAAADGCSSSAAAAAAAAAQQLFEDDSDDEQPVLAPPSDDEEAYGSSTATAADTAAADADEPSSYAEAMRGPNAAKWRGAMEEEMKSQWANTTWRLEVPPPGVRLLGNRWVFKMDFITAFLNGEVDEELWMQQPEGFETGDDGDGDGGGAGGGDGAGGDGSGGAGRRSQPLACRLLKSVYGLKQAPRCWYRKLSEGLERIGFTPATADPALFVRHDEAGPVYVLVHVDDLMIAASCPVQLAAVKSAIGDRFQVRDLGEVSIYLGMEIQREPSTGDILMLQRRYISDLLRRHRMADAKPRSLPLPPGTRVLAASAEQPALADGGPYRSLIGELNYLAVSTRPDIAFALSLLARHMAAPTKAHLELALGVLRYLKGTADMGLRFKGPPDGGVADVGGGDGVSPFSGYCDADWAGDPMTRRSQTAFVFDLCETAVSWCSQQQRTVAASSVESEYQAAAAATKEALWLRKLAADLGLSSGAVIIRSDSQGALSLARNPIASSPLSKHIDIQHHLVRERVARGEVSVQYCPTEEMTADALTKALPSAKFINCRAAMGVST